MKWNKFLCIFVISVLLAMEYILSISVIHQIKVSNQRKDSIAMYQDSINHILDFSEDNVVYFLNFYRIEYPDTVLKQTLHETNLFKSKIFIENNNLFGMKHPKQRPTTSVADSQGYALYHNYIESIKDYKIFQTLYYKGGDYYQFLINSGYAEDPDYTKKINNIRK